MYFSDDILQPIDDEELLQYVDILKKNLPINLRAHHFLLMQHKWKSLFKLAVNPNQFETISARCKFNFYKHRNGEQINCTFVAITTEGNPDYIDVN